jgi:hypothetical protein
VFRLTYAQYEPGVSKAEAWIRLAREMIFSGVWAVMPPSARTLYLVLLANSTFGHLADGEWIEMEDGSWKDDLCDFDFVPAQCLEPSSLKRLSGLADRNFRKVRGWLQDNGLIFPTSHDQRPGLIIPRNPGRYSPAVKERLATLKEKPLNRSRGGALRSLQAMRRVANRQNFGKKAATKGS